MGKLNYSSRRISGIKAGKTISKDLKKRIPSRPGSRSTAARDPHLEIDATGRDLEDAGLAEFIGDLIRCIEYKEEGHADGVVKVTELRLRGNKLTVRALENLTEVVKLSAADLRELDLSQNDIRVESAEDKRVWGKFLEAFQNCFLVRKLDLSGNEIGPVGVEVLARAYVQSELDFVEEDAEDVIGGAGVAQQDVGSAGSSSAQSSSRQSGHGRRGQPRERASASRNIGKFQASSAPDGIAANGCYSPASAHVISPHELRKFACTRGLRSIPYLILSDIELSSTGAIHLESMLAMQQTPEHLLAFLPQGKAIAVPEAENGNTGSVIWLPNDALSDHAKRLLEVSETISRLNHSGSSSDISDIDDMSEGSEYGDADAEQKQRDKLKVEYERLSKRVRLDALLKAGITGSELWSRTLLMHAVSRALLLEDKDRVVENTPEISASEEMGETSEAHEQPRESGQEEQQLETQESLGDVIAGHNTWVGDNAGPFQPGSRGFEENFPSLNSAPKAVPQESEDQSSKSDAGKTTQSSPQSKESRPKNANRRKSAPRPAQKEEWRYGLSLDQWRQIIAEAVNADGTLSTAQQVRIIRHASDWDCLKQEISIGGAQNHQQIWKYLETVGCFIYGTI
ncbi:leucine rich repeat protein [Aspergillus campestris IBT 28561]|uniref:Leucine rich repeat protein n=1 Tax=Aspergillus campestris (strain IBT 28561) TaxID=1392248 RepID=A0A2I1CT61_ASPC2|nr:leucine rich repeat protein [Aspergillus campestris IBT 28561]PKY00801.1 leucine rich repeat protein [Aspergillus campestris IBT 28561]